jgi:hypothetical protein
MTRAQVAKAKVTKAQVTKTMSSARLNRRSADLPVRLDQLR